MCFSATASFTSSAVLAFIGIKTLVKVKSPSAIMFALLPLLFALQQAAEGVVWRTLDAPHAALHRSAVSLFLFFALVLWPLWMPHAVALFDPTFGKSALAKLCKIAGFCSSGFSLFSLLTFGYDAQLVGGHLFYYFYVPASVEEFALALYCLATMAPLLASSLPGMRTLGFFMLAGLGVTLFTWYFFLISVWCFFAALASILIYKIVAQTKQTQAYNPRYFYADR